MARQQQLNEPLMVQKLDESVDDALVREQNQDLISLVGEMTGLKSLMSDVASMVSDQGVALDQSEQNVKTADVLVDDGVQQIEIASDYQWAARKKIAIIACVLVVVLAIGGTFLGLYLTGKFDKKSPPAPAPPPKVPTPTA